MYPFGINEGTIHWGLINNPGFVYPGTPSSELVALSMDLQHDASYSGNAWSCVGFPNACGAAKPLHTDKGDFYLYTPYWKTYGQKTPPVAQGQGAPSLNAGFFMTKVGTSVARPISYHGYVIADATLGGVRYAGAQVFLSFDGDAGSAVAFHSGASSYGFINRTGEARVSIVSGGRTISATFEPGQIYVYYDVGRVRHRIRVWRGLEGLSPDRYREAERHRLLCRKRPGLLHHSRCRFTNDPDSIAQQHVQPRDSHTGNRSDQCDGDQRRSFVVCCL